MKTHPTILAVDIGTTWIKTALFSASGRRFKNSLAKTPQRLRETSDGGSEIDPRALKKAFLAALAQTLSNASTAKRVTAVSISCFWHGLLGVDDRARPVTPIFTWADTRSRAHAARLRERISERGAHRRTGCMVRSSFWPAKLAWLRETAPGQLAAAARWMSAAEWLQLQFCGRTVCAPSMASGTGLFNHSRLDWDAALLKQCGLTPSQLNPVSEETLSDTSRLPSRFSALTGAVWLPAIGDGAAGNLGSGATRPDEAAVNLGTSAALRVMDRGSQSRAPFGLFCYRLDADRFLVGGAVSNAGSLRQWCLEQLQLPQGPGLDLALSKRRLPAHGLTILPFWREERAPDWNDAASGAIWGLKQSSVALDILQAANEATFHRLALILEALEKSGRKPSRLIVSGGGSQAELQRLANVLGRPVQSCPDREASLRGAAVYALERLGEPVSSPAPGREFAPEPDAVAAYRRQRKETRLIEKILAKRSAG